MGGILLLGYAAICVVVFRILRVPVNKWTMTTACVGGVVAVGGILLGMDYNQPFTPDARLYFFTTPITPTIQGIVIEVPVTPNAPLKKGDPLFKLDPGPYVAVVDQKKALLAEAEQNVQLLKASYDQAVADVNKSKADQVLAQQTYDRQRELFAKDSAAATTLDTAVRNLETAVQDLAGAEAAADRARLAYASEIGGVNTSVARAEADLTRAQIDLNATTAKAPTDGYVTQLSLRPGMVASPSTPTMVFIHNDANVLKASFSQNVLQRLNVGAEAEIVFDGIPGRVFAGRVTLVSDAIAQGQVQAGGALLDPEERNKSPTRALTRIDILDDLSGYQLPAGATAQVAVYTEHWRWTAIIRRIILRMYAWLNYVV
ncbi:MAG TPA: HlyD family secretion protein [Roseiarcus sp.]|jgi:multidrug resistance efflux pump